MPSKPKADSHTNLHERASRGMTSIAEGSLECWLNKCGASEEPDGSRSVALPGLLQYARHEVMCGKLYSHPDQNDSQKPLHTWRTATRDPTGQEASYHVEILKQPGAGKFKYTLMFRATKGSILAVQDVKARVLNARKPSDAKGPHELLDVEPHASLQHNHVYDFATNVKCRRELELEVAFVIFMKASAPATLLQDYAPPSIQTLYDMRKETGDLVLTGKDPEGNKTSMPVHSAVLKLSCAFFETALGDSWKKEHGVELPWPCNAEASEMLVRFLYLGRVGISKKLYAISDFETAEQLYMLGDALGIDPLRKLVGARIEKPDLVQQAITSQLRDHEYFRNDHFDKVAETVRDLIVENAIRANPEQLSTLCSTFPNQAAKKRQAEEMAEGNESDPEERISKLRRTDSMSM